MTDMAKTPAKKTAPNKKLAAPFPPKGGKNAIKPKIGPAPSKGLNGPVGKTLPPFFAKKKGK